MKKRLYAAAVLLLSLSLFAGCGSSAKSSGYAMTESSDDVYADYYSEAYAEEEAAVADGAYGSGVMSAKSVSNEEAGEAQSSTSEITEDTSDSQRKLIYTVTMNVETQDLESIQEFVETRTQELGGYIENSYIQGRSSVGNSSGRRYASYTIRIPADQLDRFVSQVGEEANVTSQNTSVEDITLQYVDSASRRDVLETERDSLQDMLRQAESIEDILAIRAQLTQVQSELESTESRLRVYDNQVDYSTIYLDVTEVTIYTPVETEKKPALQRMKEGFMNSLEGAATDVQEFLIGVVIDIPYIVLTVIAIILIILIAGLFIRLFLRIVTGKSRAERREEKRARKEEKKRQKEEKRRQKEEKRAGRHSSDERALTPEEGHTDEGPTEQTD